MPSPNAITVDKLARRVGLADAPTVIDVRVEADLARDARVLPGSVWRDYRSVAAWGTALAGSRVVVACQRGAKLSEGVAAWLRHLGAQAENLEGGFEAWAAAGAPLVSTQNVPGRDAQGRTVWVTRSRPKVDRIACPWLIRRFVDPHAIFLYVAPAEVETVARKYSAAPFDIEGDDVFWSHQNERSTFDVMVEALGL